MPPKKRVAKTKTVKSEAKKVKTETSPLAYPEPETKKVTKSMTVVGLVPVNNGDTESTWNFNAYGGVANFKVVDFATYASLCKKTPAAEIGAFHAMLNQTNIGANNNKYYLCQVLK